MLVCFHCNNFSTAFAKSIASILLVGILDKSSMDVSLFVYKLNGSFFVTLKKHSKRTDKK